MNDTTPPSSPSRPSACPGLWRIVAARDGGICRIKLPGGYLTSAQARAVAQASSVYASGVLDATNRGNLQLRGVRADTAPALIECLLDAGLGAPTPGADDVRNLMLSPVAGLDPASAFDSRPLGQRFLNVLQSQPRLRELSPKFAILLDGGEALAMREHAHDVWFAAMDESATPHLAFGLAGCPDPLATLANVSVAHAEELLIAVLALFLDLAKPEHTRMRHLLGEISSAAFMAQLAPRLSFALGAARQWQLPKTAHHGHIGIYPQLLPGVVAVGGVAPLGRLEARQLNRLAGLAERFGDGSLRLTPWQSVLLPNVHSEHANEVMAIMSHSGLLCSSELAMAHVLACTGSAGCAKGCADTKADALRLAEQLAGNGLTPAVHLSGCARSCAAAHCVANTLLATAPGRYDLYRRDAMQPGFGELRASHLTIEQVGVLLHADVGSHPDA